MVDMRGEMAGALASRFAPVSAPRCRRGPTFGSDERLPRGEVGADSEAVLTLLVWRANLSSSTRRTQQQHQSVAHTEGH